MHRRIFPARLLISRINLPHPWTVFPLHFQGYPSQPLFNDFHYTVLTLALVHSFNPMMFVNMSGTCATSKLIQCRDFGCYQVDISSKFDQPPGRVPDLSRDDFLARKNVLRGRGAWEEETRRMGTDRVYVRGMLYSTKLSKLSLRFGVRSSKPLQNGWCTISFVLRGGTQLEVTPV